MTGRGRDSARAARARAFTLLEIMIVIGVILTLMTLVLGVGSALLRNAEKSQVESAMAIMESALNEYEAQMGRQMTFNGAWNAGGTAQFFPPGVNAATGDTLFDVRDAGLPPAPANGANAPVMWAARARGAGVFAANLLRQVDSVRPILAGISPGLLRPEFASATFSWLTRDIAPSGVMGDPTPATAENGHRWCEAMSDRIARALVEMHDFREILDR